MVKKFSFNPEKDIPSLKGKVILITGGTNGIGKEAALQFAKHDPEQIWIAARNPAKGKSTIDEIKAAVPKANIHILEMDLSSLSSVAKAADEFLATAPRLDILMLNAGIFGGPFITTEDGYELRFGTNHMGHALLTKKLTPLLFSTASGKPRSDVRVICLSSSGHGYAKEFKLDKFTKPATDVISAYTESKLSNLYFAQQLSKRFPQLTSIPLDPGDIKTDLFTPNGAGFKLWALNTFVVPLVGMTVAEGAKNQLWCATAKDVVSGEYYSPVGVTGKMAGLGGNEKNAEELWEWTEKELAAKGY